MKLAIPTTPRITLICLHLPRWLITELTAGVQQQLFPKVFLLTALFS